MLGVRPLSFYKQLKKLKNVILVSPFLHKDPKQYIQDCKGVVTVTGTSALEAALLGKPSIIFGATSYEVLSCVHKISDITKIKDIISQWDTNEKHPAPTGLRHAGHQSSNSRRRVRPLLDRLRAVTFPATAS